LLETKAKHLCNKWISVQYLMKLRLDTINGVEEQKSLSLKRLFSSGSRKWCQQFRWTSFL